MSDLDLFGAPVEEPAPKRGKQPNPEPVEAEGDEVFICRRCGEDADDCECEDGPDIGENDGEEFTMTVRAPVRVKPTYCAVSGADWGACLVTDPCGADPAQCVQTETDPLDAEDRDDAIPFAGGTAHRQRMADGTIQLRCNACSSILGGPNAMEEFQRECEEQGEDWRDHEPQFCECALTRTAWWLTDERHEINGRIRPDAVSEADRFVVEGVTYGQSYDKYGRSEDVFQNPDGTWTKQEYGNRYEEWQLASVKDQHAKGLRRIVNARVRKLIERIDSIRKKPKAAKKQTEETRRREAEYYESQEMKRQLFALVTEDAALEVEQVSDENFKLFQSSGVDVEDIGGTLDVDHLRGIPGRVYLDPIWLLPVWIERVSPAVKFHRDHGEMGDWFTEYPDIFRDWPNRVDSNDLAEVEHAWAQYLHATGLFDPPYEPYDCSKPKEASE